MPFGCSVADVQPARSASALGAPRNRSAFQRSAAAATDAAAGQIVGPWPPLLLADARAVSWWWHAPFEGHDPAVDNMLDFVRAHTDIETTVIMQYLTGVGQEGARPATVLEKGALRRMLQRVHHARCSDSTLQLTVTQKLGAMRLPERQKYVSFVRYLGRFHVQRTDAG